MKKYFIAAMVALAVFAMSAFAATLTVDGGVIQAGSDGPLTCSTEGVSVVTYGTESDDLTVRSARLAGLDGCVGEEIIIRWNTGEAGTQVDRQIFTLTDADLNTAGEYTYTFPEGGVPAASLDELVVMIATSAS